MDNDPAFLTAALSVVAGIALAAACGFRVFIPLLVVSAASRAGLLSVSDGFAWIAGTPALVCFASAAALEVLGYWIPWLDHALDVLATPAAVVAGIVVSAAVITGVDPWLEWTLSAVAGGGAAAAVQIPSVIARASSSATTGGLANPLVATGELAASGGVSAAAVLFAALPIALPLVALVLVWVAYRRIRAREAPVPA